MKTINPFIYIVVPVYNSMKYLQTAVESVLRQGLSDLMMILVDDGSSDGSSDFCDEMSDKYDFIKVIHQENAGVSAARNRGMDYIFSVNQNKNAYVVFLDADDALTDDAVSDDIKELLTHGYDCVGLQYAACNAKLTRCEVPVKLPEGEYPGGNKSIRIHHTQFFASMFYRAEFLKEKDIRFYPIRYSEDKVFNMQCLFMAERVYLKNHIMYLHRNSPGSVMNTREYGIAYYEPIINAYLQMDKELHEKSGEPVVQGHILARVYLIEMIKEHYQFGGTEEELSGFFGRNPELEALLKDTSVGNKALNRLYDELESRKTPNPIAGRIYGASYRLGKQLLGGVYSSATDKRRYPMEVSGLNTDSDKKRILFLIHDLGQGGAEKVLVNLVNNMHKDKFSVTVMVLFGGGVHEKDLSSDVRLIRCHPKNIPGNSHWMKMFTPRQLYRYYIKEHYDLAVSFLEGPCSRIISGCDDPSVKTVSWIHCTMQNEKVFSEGFRSFQEAKECYGRVNAICFVSKGVQNAFNRVYEPDVRQHVLYNTNESEKIIRMSLEDVSEMQDSSDEIRWCGIGKLTWNKGFDRMIQIQKKLTDDGINAHLYILGAGEEEESLNRLAGELNITDKVTFLGFQKNPYKYLSKCDLYVCASHSEGFSTAATEALIVGTPVCTVDVSGMKELLGEQNEWGIVTDNDDECLYEAVKDLMKSPSKLDGYRILAKERGEAFRTDATVAAAEQMLGSL